MNIDIVHQFDTRRLQSVMRSAKLNVIDQLVVCLKLTEWHLLEPQSIMTTVPPIGQLNVGVDKIETPN